MQKKTQTLEKLDVYPIPSLDGKKWWGCVIDVGTAPITCKRSGSYREVEKYFNDFYRRLYNSYCRNDVKTICDPWNNRRRKKRATFR